MEEKFNWGVFEIHLDVSNGKIDNCKCFTDSIVMENFRNLEEMLCNKKLEKNAILEVIKKCIEKDDIKNDICCLIKNKL